MKNFWTEDTDEQIDEFIRHVMDQRPQMLREEFDKATTSMEQRLIIRKAYILQLRNIMDSPVHLSMYGIDPYFLDWDLIMSPLEKQAWSSIRCRSIVLYPEFPVLDFFIDFANPILKIAVELDGKKWHSSEKDLKKDFDRDMILSNEGWTIYRIQGYEAYKRYLDYYDIEELHPDDASQEKRDDELENWILNTADGFFEALWWKYFLGCPESSMRGIMELTLQTHVSREPIL